MKRELVFLGAGGAFAHQDQYQSNCVIKTNDGLMLLDCGSDIRFSLTEKYPHINNGNILDYIKWVYISHLHGDHCYGLEWLGFCTYFSQHKDFPLNLISDESITEQLWNNVLSGTMEDIVDKKMSLKDYFKVFNPVNNMFQLGCYEDPIKFTTVESPHVFPNKKSYGLFIETYKQKTYFTSDVNKNNYEINKKYYHDADVIFQDCETYPYKSGVHYHYEDLLNLPKDIKKKMWLYHHNVTKDKTTNYKLLKNGFNGFCMKGNSFEI